MKRVPILFLAGGIKDVEERYLVVDDTLFPVRVWRMQSMSKEVKRPRNEGAQ